MFMEIQILIYTQEVKIVLRCKIQIAKCARSVCSPIVYNIDLWFYFIEEFSVVTKKNEFRKGNRHTHTYSHSSEWEGKWKEKNRSAIHGNAVD